MKPDLYIERPWEDSDFDTGLYPITPEEFDQIARAEGYVKLDGIDVEALREAATLSVHDLAALDWRKVEVMHDFTLSVLAALDGETS